LSEQLQLSESTTAGNLKISGFVKDYQMPADEQRLADDISVAGRHLIILNNSRRLKQLVNGAICT
jgi:hypothetical protein